MDCRLDLHNKLKSILMALDGVDNVYYQPPELVKMKYPCFIYKFDSYETDHADDIPYRLIKVYSITYISKDPLSLVPDKLALTKGFRFDRHYMSNNLHHHVFEYRK